MKNELLGGLIVGMIIGMLAGFVGMAILQHELRQDAIEAHVGRWTTTPEGDTTWAWGAWDDGTGTEDD